MAGWMVQLVVVVRVETMAERMAERMVDYSADCSDMHWVVQRVVLLAACSALNWVGH